LVFLVAARMFEDRNAVIQNILFACGCRYEKDTAVNLNDDLVKGIWQTKIERFGEEFADKKGVIEWKQIN